LLEFFQYLLKIQSILAHYTQNVNIFLTLFTHHSLSIATNVDNASVLAVFFRKVHSPS